MAKPIVRLGDMTAHGGVVVVGCPTVLAGGKPVARIGDMHTCPMSDGPKPHVGGPIVGPGAPTVLVGGVPAAAVGDTATCVGPPDALTMGCPNVMVG